VAAAARSYSANEQLAGAPTDGSLCTPRTPRSGGRGHKKETLVKDLTKDKNDGKAVARVAKAVGASPRYVQEASAPTGQEQGAQP